MPRKHLIASATNKKQQKQAKFWQKISKEIRTAAKVGGQNVDANPRLKAAIERALQSNLSRESIERNISGAIKDPQNLSTFIYECFGPKGAQFIITALTDNNNRTTSNLRGYLSKINGQIAKPNTIKIHFTNKGYFVLVKNQTTTEDSILECLIDAQDLDIVAQEKHYIIYVNPNSYYEAKKNLEKCMFQIQEYGLKPISDQKILIDDDKILEKIEHFLDSCDNDDDIQSVFHNLDSNYC